MINRVRSKAKINIKLYIYIMCSKTKVICLSFHVLIFLKGYIELVRKGTSRDLSKSRISNNSRYLCR